MCGGEDAVDMCVTSQLKMCTTTIHMCFRIPLPRDLLALELTEFCPLELMGLCALELTGLCALELTELCALEQTLCFLELMGLGALEVTV